MFYILGGGDTYIYSKRLPPYLHLLKMVATIPSSTQNDCHHTYIYSKKVWTFSNSWNWKNRWWERILNCQEGVTNWREHILRSKKISDENSGVQKVRSCNNHRIPQNSERISQPKQWEWTNKTWTGYGLDKSERGGFAMTMTRRMRTEGRHQCIEWSSAASGAYHRRVEDEKEARKVLVLVTAMKREEDA